uniref:Small T-antigen n=1 Tax=MW polyomavirus TaxID=1203539 RepID=R4KW41_9POLY|nr:small T-antigen [MW polyomavirus]
MDRVLSRDEVKELMALLSLNTAAWGNIPLMQYKYRQTCLKLPPDKGGDGEKMKRLNELFSKMYTTIEKLRREGEVYFPAKVGYFIDDVVTLGDVLGPSFEEKIIYIWPLCASDLLRHKCGCVCCLLKKQHRNDKLAKQKQCLVWGECFCYKCFLLWFGQEFGYTSFFWWKHIMHNTEFDLLRLLGELILWVSCFSFILGKSHLWDS